MSEVFLWVCIRTSPNYFSRNIGCTLTASTSCGLIWPKEPIHIKPHLEATPTTIAIQNLRLRILQTQWAFWMSKMDHWVYHYRTFKSGRRAPGLQRALRLAGKTASCIGAARNCSKGSGGGCSSPCSRLPLLKGSKRGALPEPSLPEPF